MNVVYCPYCGKDYLSKHDENSMFCWECRIVIDIENCKLTEKEKLKLIIKRKINKAIDDERINQTTKEILDLIIDLID